MYIFCASCPNMHCIRMCIVSECTSCPNVHPTRMCILPDMVFAHSFCAIMGIFQKRAC